MSAGEHPEVIITKHTYEIQYMEKCDGHFNTQAVATHCL